MVLNDKQGQGQVSDLISDLLRKSDSAPAGVKNDEKKDADSDSTDDELEADKKDAMGKSNSAQDLDSALEQSITAVRNLLTKSGTSRKDELLVKAQSSTLSEDEKAELIKALSGNTEPDEISKSMGRKDDAAFQNVIDVDATGFLSGLHKGLTESLGLLSDKLSKSTSAQLDTNAVLAKAVHDLCVVQQAQAKLMKSLTDQLASWGRQPVRAPKSAGVGAVTSVVEPTRGAPGSAPVISKADILARLEKSAQAAFVANNTALSEQLSHALVRYEATNTLDAETIELLTKQN